MSKRRDRGEATAQLVILVPLLVLLTFLGIQAAIYFHAANVAAAAASQGAAAGSRSGSGPSDAVRAATRTLADLKVDPAQPPVALDDNGFVTVSVVVAVAQLLPFFPDTVRRTAIEPKERFVPESDR